MKKKTILKIILLLVIAGGGYYFLTFKNQESVKKIEIIQDGDESTEVADVPALNDKDVSPISGIACENWNKRPIAVMQPSDIQARPAAGFSDADMVIEMAGYTGSVTRLMGVYVCNLPKEVGAIRSSRHDYLHIAKGLDAVFFHWGGSHFALDLLEKDIIDHVDCMTYSGKYCMRWNWNNDPINPDMRKEDSGHITSATIIQAVKDLGFRTEGKFSGYPHQAELPLDQRPDYGKIRIGYPDPYDVNYYYDKQTNSWLRQWNKKDDIDRNNNQQHAPKNVVILTASSYQITNDIDFTSKGLQDPWAEVEEIKNTGAESISDRYNNMEIGDPWYDLVDSGAAYYYMNGKEYKGTWKKDKSNIASKLLFYDEAGNEIKFVPGQIWVSVVEPYQQVKFKNIPDEDETQQ